MATKLGLLRTFHPARGGEVHEVSPAALSPHAVSSGGPARQVTPFAAVGIVFGIQLLAGAGPVLVFPLYLAVTLVAALRLGRVASIGSALLGSAAIMAEPFWRGAALAEAGPELLLAISLPLVSIGVGEVIRQARLRTFEARGGAASVAASEQRLRAILEAATVGLALTDLGGHLRLANERFTHILGLEREGQLPKSLSDVIATADRPALQQAMARLRSGEIARWESEVGQERAGGGLVPVAIAISRVAGPASTDPILLVEESDISARRRAETLREALGSLQQLMAGSPAWEGVMPALLAGLGRHLAWDAARFWEVQPDATAIAVSHEWRSEGMPSDPPLRRPRPTLSRGAGLAGGVWQSGVVAAESGSPSEPGGEDALAGISAAAAFPVIDGGAVLGVIELLSRSGRGLGDDEAMLLTTVGVEIARFIRRSATEQALRRSEADHRAIFERSPIGIARVSSEGELLEANPALLQMLELEFEPMRQARWPELLRSYDQAASRLRRPPLLAGITDANAVQLRAATGGGRWLWLQLTATSIPDASGRLEHLLVMVEDVTAVRETSDKLAEALESQRSANANLERIDRTKTEFLSITSHEFRTALTGIQGFSELIRDGGLEPDEVRAYGGYIFNDADRVNRLIGDMLDLDRMESGRMTIRLGDVDLNQVLTDSIARVRKAAPTLEFKADLDPHLPSVVGDRDRLIQVVSNLVSNAVKYSSEGGSVTLTSRLEGGYVLVGVSDTGLGIPPEEIAHVFERFRRVRSGAAQAIAGTGLGLAIVKQIVEMHGGKIWVESAVGHGSSFHFMIQVAPEAETPIKPLDD